MMKMNKKIFIYNENFKNSQTKNLYHPSVFGVGYLGEGKYKTKINGKHTKAYSYWYRALTRCYDPYTLNKYPTYIDCYVCKEWLCFQNFAKWFYKHYYEVPGERMELDKDILFKGNKIYSPDTCVFVPKRINYLFTKSDATRGEYPIGVHYCYDKKGYEYLISQCQTLGKQKYLGCFSLNEPFHAFYVYKQFKENYIKQVADEYKDLIPKELYDAMYKWEVEIND